MKQLSKQSPEMGKSSVQPRKQRRWLARMPLHKRQKLMSSLLAKDLQKKNGRRNIGVRKGDKVKILRGQFKKRIGAVLSVDTKKQRVFVDGIELQKKNGSKVPFGIHPSKIMILETYEDKKRFKHVKGGNA